MISKAATLDLGRKPIGVLLLQYALPAIIAMAATSLYNIIDRVFIGQCLGANAISGLAVTFPFMTLSAAFGAAIGIGSSTTISIRLGQKDYAAANLVFGNTIILNFIVGISFALLSIVFLDPILRLFGASHQTLPYAREFMLVLLIGTTITHMFFGLNASLRAISKPKYAMFATIFTVLMNIVLDALFILVFNWGIKGAAWATILSQLMALSGQLKIFSNKEEVIHYERNIFRVKKHIIHNIISIGISPFLMNACACFIIIFINNQLAKYGGDIAIGAFGISNSIIMIFIMFIIGLNQGMQPVAGYNYGAQNTDRLFKTLQITIIAATCIMSIGWIISTLCPKALAQLFTTDAKLIDVAAIAIQTTMIMFPIIGAQMVITNFFQCIGKVRISIFLSLSRQLLFLLPLLLILPKVYQLKGVWIAMPISDFISTIVSIIVLILYIKKQKT